MLLLTHHTSNFEDEMFEAVGHVMYPEDCDDDEGLNLDNLPRHIEQQFIASGYFSSVWAIPGEPFKVLKISHRDEDACRYYMQWAKEHPSRHGPNIERITYRENLMMVTMERYYPLEDDPTLPFDKSLACRENVPGHKVLCLGHTPKHDDSLEQYCAQVRRVFRGHKFDLHQANVMQTRDGTIIITDPVSFTESYAS